MTRDIVWRLHLSKPPARVYETLATAEGRARFWAESAVEANGCVHFVFPNGQRIQSRIVEARVGEAFALEYFGGVARFVLTPDGCGGTDLELQHQGVPAEEWNDTYAGWVSLLLTLKAAQEFGIDLRNHDPTRTWDQRYVDP